MTKSKLKVNKVLLDKTQSTKSEKTITNNEINKNLSSKENALNNMNFVGNNLTSYVKTKLDKKENINNVKNDYDNLKKPMFDVLMNLSNTYQIFQKDTLKNDPYSVIEHFKKTKEAMNVKPNTVNVDKDHKNNVFVNCDERWDDINKLYYRSSKFSVLNFPNYNQIKTNILKSSSENEDKTSSKTDKNIKPPKKINKKPPKLKEINIKKTKSSSHLKTHSKSENKKRITPKKEKPLVPFEKSSKTKSEKIEYEKPKQKKSEKIENEESKQKKSKKIENKESKQKNHELIKKEKINNKTSNKESSKENLSIKNKEKIKSEKKIKHKAKKKKKLQTEDEEPLISEISQSQDANLNYINNEIKSNSLKNKNMTMTYNIVESDSDQLAKMFSNIGSSVRLSNEMTHKILRIMVKKKYVTEEEFSMNFEKLLKSENKSSFTVSSFTSLLKEKCKYFKKV